MFSVRISAWWYCCPLSKSADRNHQFQTTSTQISELDNCLFFLKYLLQIQQMTKTIGNKYSSSLASPFSQPMLFNAKPIGRKCSTSYKCENGGSSKASPKSGRGSFRWLIKRVPTKIFQVNWHPPTSSASAWAPFVAVAARDTLSSTPPDLISHLSFHPVLFLVIRTASFRREIENTRCHCWVNLQRVFGRSEEGQYARALSYLSGYEERDISLAQSLIRSKRDKSIACGNVILKKKQEMLRILEMEEALRTAVVVGKKRYIYIYGVVGEMFLSHWLDSSSPCVTCSVRALSYERALWLHAF